MRAVRAGVHGLGELLITLGLVLLLFVVWQLWWTDVAAGRTQRDGVTRLEQQWGRSAAGAGTATPASTPVKAPPLLRDLEPGQAFALIRIPRFGRDYVRPVVEGTGLDVLQNGVGHYPATAPPGGVGNFSLAGHRVTYAKPFNRIAELRRGDPVVIETRTAWYVYRVQRHVIVTPDRTEVVAPVPQRRGVKPTKRMMTMTACHPMFSARERYVVFSELDEVVVKASGEKPDVLR